LFHAEPAAYDNKHTVAPTQDAGTNIASGLVEPRL
jgi:hypothetical protein